MSPTRLDINPAHNPDVIWDLNKHPLPFDDESFDEIHAYQILEHLGSLGDADFFCSEWNEYYRILKPGGYFFGTVPSMDSPWLLGDPTHRRVICKETLIFLDRNQYEKQVGVTPMTDLRHKYKGDFDIVHYETQKGIFAFVMRKKHG